MLRASDTSQDGNRFSALLNPIRDIAASWGIDVAKELSDYAESLGIDISQGAEAIADDDNLGATIDFAQAALLVQGSTSIYSRKVEHLYSLVYTAVTAMSQMSRMEKRTSGAPGAPVENDAEADALLDMDEEVFLSLDDKVPEADPRSITLPPESQRLSGRDETLLQPIPPMLIRRTGNVNNQLGSVTYKMSTAHTHSSGALIMEGCPPVTEDLETLPEQQDLSPNIDITQPFENACAEPDYFGNTDDGNMPMSPSGSDTDLVKAAVDPRATNSKSVAVAASRAIQQTAALYGITSSQAEPKPPKLQRNFHPMLEPHREVPELDKPLKVGKTYRRPRKRSFPIQPASAYNPSLIHGTDVVGMFLNKLSYNIRTYVSFPGIKEAHATVVKKRRALQRARSRQCQKAESTIGYQQDEGFENDYHLDEDNYLGDEDNDFDNEGHDGIESPEHLRLRDQPRGDDHPDLGPVADSDDLQLGSQLEYLASSYEDICRRHLQETSHLWEQRTTDVDLLQRIQEWAARIHPILDEEERRPEFDISAYSLDIVNTLEGLSLGNGARETRISMLLQQRARYNVSRRFLATLQLANSYSLAIVPPDGCTVTDFVVKHTAKQGLRKLTTKRDTVVGMQPATVGPPEGLSLKRSRVPNTTPKSARRQPLRPRLQPQVAPK